MHFVKCKMLTIFEEFSKIQVNIIMEKGGQQEKSGKI